MLADDVDTARATRHKVGTVVIFLVELGNETFPALLVLGGNRVHGGIVGRVDLRDGFCLRDELLRGRHGGVYSLDLTCY